MFLLCTSSSCYAHHPPVYPINDTGCFLMSQPQMQYMHDSCKLLSWPIKVITACYIDAAAGQPIVSHSEERTVHDPTETETPEIIENG